VAQRFRFLPDFPAAHSLPIRRGPAAGVDCSMILHLIRRFFPLLLLGVILAGLIWAVPLGQLPPADYTIASGGDVKTIDPALASGVPEGRVIGSLFEGLCASDPRTLEPVPGVAERWEISPDLKTYTFFLRDNAKWSDGAPVTAEDFVWSMRRVLHPQTASEYSSEMWRIENAKRYTKRELRVGDPVEIEVLTEQLSPAEQALWPPAALASDQRALRGKMLAIEKLAAEGENISPADEKKSSASKPPAETPLEQVRYVVEIKGVPRSFHKTGRHGEPFEWLLLDPAQIAIRALSPRKLEFRLEDPFPYFLHLMKFYPYAPVQRACLERHGRNWTKAGNMISNGPFRLDTRRYRERIRVVKNENYWDRDAVKLNSADFLGVESHSTALNFYLTGQADWIEFVPISTTPELLAQQRPDFQPAPYITLNFYRMNVTDPQLSNKKLRQALNLAIDKRAIVERITRAGQTPARNLVSPVIKGYEPALCGDYDPVRARQLYDEARAELFAAGVIASPQAALKLKLQYNTNERHQAVAEFAQDQWQRNLGASVQLNGLEWAALQANWNELNYKISRSGWVGDYPDPATFLGLFASDGTNNQTGWKNEEYDGLLNKAKRSPDLAERNKFYQQAEAILMEELPIMPLYFDVSTSMSRTYVKGVYPNFHDLHPLKGIWIDQDEKQKALAAERAR